MRFTQAITALAAFVTVALAARCNHDNCYRALVRYQSSTSAGFCSEYLATSTKQAPSPIATCGPKRISSACSCLTTSSTTKTTTSTTSTLTPSTCARSSASACPTPPSKCCAYLCSEAQVPFDICSETDTSGEFEVCNKCPTETATTTTTTFTPTTTITTTTTTSAPTLTSTCARSSASACPTPASKCCAYLCSEAQVPFDICSETDTSGEFEVCNKCAA